MDGWDPDWVRVARATIEQARRDGCACDDPVLWPSRDREGWHARIRHHDESCPLAHPQTAGPLAGSPSAGAGDTEFVDDRLEARDA